MARKGVSHASALFTIVSISTFFSFLLMFFFDLFSSNSIIRQKPKIISRQIDQVIEATNLEPPPKNESQFKPIGESWICLQRPKVQVTQNIPNTISKENLFQKLKTPQSHPTTPLGQYTQGTQTPSIDYPINQNIFLYHVTDALFTSEAVFIQDNKYVLFTEACHPRYWGMFYRPVDFVNLTYKQYEHAICLGHQHSSDFGHWFLEVLPAYAIMPKEILSKSVVVVPFIRKHVIDGFKFIGVSEDQIVEGDNIPVFAHHYYTMDYIFCGDLNVYLITNLRQHFYRKFGLGKTPPTEFLTFNRPNMSRCIKNYDEVRNALKKEWPNIDWKDGIYHKTLAEQAVYFDRVKFLFAVHGSVLSNIIFMQDNTAIVDLQMEQWLLSFLWLTAYTGKYMVVGRDPRISWRGLAPNQIDVSYVIELVGKALKLAGYI